MPTIETRRLNPIALTGIVLAVVALAILAIRMFTREVVGIRAAAATHQNLLSTVSTNGRVEPIEYFQAQLRLPAWWRDLRRGGPEGQKGDLLIKMDDADVSARLATAKSLSGAGDGARRCAGRIAGGADPSPLPEPSSDAETAGREGPGRVETATAEGCGSGVRWPLPRERLDAANATLANVQQRQSDRYSSTDRSKVQAQLGDAQAAVAAAQNSYANANIRTPLSGSVYSIPVSQYDFVSAREDLMDVADLNRIQVRAYFDEPEIKLAVGRRADRVGMPKPSGLARHISAHPHSDHYGTRNVGECLLRLTMRRRPVAEHGMTVTVTTSQRFVQRSREALHTRRKRLCHRVVQGKLVRTSPQIGVSA
jgi:HlyD family secretion protein